MTTTSSPSWYESYENHIKHCSIYIAVIACVYRGVSIPLSSPLDVLPLLLGGFAVSSLYYEIRYMIKRRNLPAGDSGRPIFGHLLDFITKGPRTMKLELFPKYQNPPMITFNMLMHPIVSVVAEEDVRWWMAQERKGNVIPHQLSHVLKLVGPEAVFVSHSTTHRRLRKIFEPSFSLSSIREYVEQIDATTNAELEKWEASDSYRKSEDWAILAMRLFFVCAFGKVDEDLLENLSRSFQTWAEGFAVVISYPLPGTKFRRALAARADLFKMLIGMVHEFKQDHPPDSPGVGNTMMGRLCYGVDDDGKPLSEDQLITNILFILFAGHDTTKGSFCAFAHYLNEYPDIRSQLQKEAKSFSEPLNMDELKSAPLLNAFLAETWRFVPPLSSHNVGTVVDNMEYKGYTFPKGTGVSIDIQAFSILDKQRYPDPWEFRLERWLPKDHPLYNPKYFQEGVDYNVPSTKYRAFGMGAHMCLGAHFAKLEARIVLTRLLQRYDIGVRNNELNKVPLLQFNNDFKLTKRGRSKRGSSKTARSS